MHVQFAAHVDHKVTHASSVGTIGLGLAGVIVAAAVIASAPVSLTVAGVATAAGTVGLFGGLGMDLGKIVDGFLAPAEAGTIERGLESVRLGPDRKPAARAFTDTVVNCHTKEVAQGSLLVMLGPERRPMSRKADQLRCKTGRIAEGLKTVLVGGLPSELGQQSSGAHPLERGMGLMFSALSLAKALGTGAVRESVAGGVGLALEAAGQEEAASVAKLGGLTRPTSSGFMRAVDWADTANGAYKGGSGAVDLGSQFMK